MYEAMEGTVLVALAAGAAYALTRTPDPELITPEPFVLTWRWPDRLRPGHRRAIEAAAETEADSFIGELHDAGTGEDAALPEPARRFSRPQQASGRHRRPGPAAMTLSRADLPSAEETMPVAQTTGRPPWEIVALEAEPVLGADVAVTQGPPPQPAPPRVYTGPDQQDPPTSVMRVRDILARQLGPYLDELPKYPED